MAKFSSEQNDILTAEQDAQRQRDKIEAGPKRVFRRGSNDSDFQFEGGGDGSSEDEKGLLEAEQEAQRQRNIVESKPVHVFKRKKSDDTELQFEDEDEECESDEEDCKVPTRRRLSEGEKGFFDAHGYVILRGVLTDDDFEDFEDEYGKLIDSKVTALLEAGFISNTHAGLPFSKRLAAVSHDCTDEVFQKYINPFLNDLDCMHARTKAFYNFISNQRVLDVVEGIVGEEILCNPIQHVRCYLPVRNGVQMSGNIASLAPWHQDQGVTREEADASEILTCWVPLFDVAHDTGMEQDVPGGLEVLPDCFKNGLLPHVKSAYGTTIDPSIIPKDTAGTSCEMKRGDVLLMNRFTPHRGTPNRSRNVRWSLDMRFQKIGTPTGRHFWPDFIVRSASNPESVQTDEYSEWCRRWVDMLASSKGMRWHRPAGTGDF
jgi:phytanoyl-CoA hydroxylase